MVDSERFGRAGFALECGLSAATFAAAGEDPTLALLSLVLELASDAVHEAWGEAHDLVDIEVAPHSFMFVYESLRLVFGGDGRFVAHGIRPSGSIECVRGRLERAAQSVGAAPLPPCGGTAVEAARIEEDLRRLRLGTPFADVALRPVVLEDEGGSQLVIEATFRAEAGAPGSALDVLLRLACWAQARDTGLVLPTSIARFRMVIPPPATSSVRVNRRGGAEDAVDAYLLGGSREVVAAIEGMRFAALVGGADATLSWLTALAYETLAVACDPDEDLIAAGASSLDLLRLVNAVERDLGRRVDVAAFLREPRIRSLLAPVAGGAGAAECAKREAEVRAPELAHRLSDAEHQLWLLEQVNDTDGAFNEAYAMRFEAGFDARIFERAVRALCRRHAALRATFASVGGTPSKVIVEEGSVDLHVVDLGELPIDEGEREARQILEQSAVRPFDLAHGPLVRCVMVRVAGDAYFALLVAHHLIVDEWSLTRILLPELVALYRAASDPNGSSPGPATALSGGGSVVGVRAAAPDAEGSVRWWSEFLQGVPAEVMLPRARERMSGNHRGASYTQLLPFELGRRLSDLARSERATPYSAWLSAFQLVMSRICDQTLFSVGVFASGRSAATEDVVGCFANLLPIRVDLRAPISVRELIRRVYVDVAGALAHQDVGFPEIVRTWGVRSAALDSPVQLVFADESRPSRVYLGNAQGEWVGLDPARARFDLHVSVSFDEEHRSCRVRWNYRVDQFGEAAIVRWAEMFERAIAEMVAAPDSPAESVTMLRSDQLDNLLHLGAGAVVETGANCVCELVAAQYRCGDAPAVISSTEVLSYAGLERRVRALAGAIDAQTTEADALVGVCVERGVNLPVALLAVLRSGHAYVPLDPELPPSRLRRIVRDAGISFIISSAGGSVPEQLVGARHLIVEDAIDADVASPLPTMVRPRADELAYAIYTSGSTGEPKGVLIERGALVNVIEAVARLLGGSGPCRWLAVTSVSFDIAALELLLPLTLGGTVLIHDALSSGAGDLARWPQRLAELGVEPGVTHLQCTPSGLELVLRTDGALSLLAGLQHLVIGGEVFPPGAARRARGAIRGRLWNAYGPTETTIWSTMHEVGPSTGTVPIGRPLANTGLYVLDHAGRLAPRGSCGELHIGGMGVARGYLGRADLTDARFVDDPYAALSGRMYRTGDIVRWSDSGELTFVGRRDAQLKVRGVRVEPAEVEAALEEIPWVSQAAVVERKLRGRAALVAFVSLSPPGGTVEEIRSALEGMLPVQLVPSLFVVQETLPTTQGGKVDKRALAAFVIERAAGARNAATPATSTERQLLEIWQQELDAGGSDVGVEDDFFDLGGDSLTAITLVSRIHSELGCAIDVRTLLRCRTVRTLAKALEDKPLIRPLARALHVSGKARRNLSLAQRELEVGLDGPVSGAALATIPDRFYGEAVHLGWLGDKPSWRATLKTAFGNIALITLPLSDSEALGRREVLVEQCTEGLALARELGARRVALTGLIPSATGYGLDLSARAGAALLTTGHGATTAAVAMAVEGLLRGTQRPIERESVAFVGLGSVGAGVLELLLALGHEPRSIVLADLSKRKAWLEELRSVAFERFAFDGEIVICDTDRGGVDPVYEASLVVGATSLPDVLDVERFQPGTMIVDDSAPHCFCVEAALARMRRSRDVVFAGAGALRLPTPVEVVIAGRSAAADWLLVGLGSLLGSDEHEIMACTLSSVLAGREAGLGATSGVVTLEDSKAHHAWFRAHGFDHAAYRLAGESVPDTLLSEAAALARPARAS